MGWPCQAGELEGSEDPQPELSMNSRTRHFTAAHMLSRLLRLLIPTGSHRRDSAERGRTGPVAA